MVMYAGKVVEHATCDQIFDEPLHPYTAGLMSCIPRLDGDDAKELSVIEGMVPSFDDMPELMPSVQDVLMQRKSAESRCRS